MASTDDDLHGRITALVAEEHELNAGSPPGGDDAADAQTLRAERHARRQQIEQQLDQCWDLLRQRQARREAGEDPASAELRPVEQVENYPQ